MLFSVVGCVAAMLLPGPELAHAAQITRVGQWVPPFCGSLYGMAVSARYAYAPAYVPSGPYLQVIDLNNPAVPVVVGGTSMSGGAFGVKVHGNYAYVVFYGLEVLTSVTRHPETCWRYQHNRFGLRPCSFRQLCVSGGRLGVAGT